MKTNSIMHEKKKYFSPLINVIDLILEDKITTASAYFVPGPESGNIQENWTEAPDVQQDFMW